MTTSVSRRLNILYIRFKIIEFFIYIRFKIIEFFIYIRFKIIEFFIYIRFKIIEFFIYIRFKIIEFFIIAMFARLYVRVGILLTCRNTSMTASFHKEVEVRVNKTSLNSPLFINVNEQRKLLFMYLWLKLSILPRSAIFHWILELFRQCDILCFFYFIAYR